MTKYHINKNGVPAACSATKGNCPFGSNHFSSLKEAQAEADYINELSAKVDSVCDGLHKNEKSFVKRHNLSETKEIYRFALQSFKNCDSYFLIEDNSTKQIVFINEKGERVKVPGFNRMRKRIKEKYMDLGYDESKIKNIVIRSVYIDKDNPENFIVHNGGSDVLDGAVFYGDQMKIIEAKHTEVGAQQSRNAIGISGSGKPGMRGVSTDALDQRLSKFNVDKDVKTTRNNLGLSSEESLEYFVRTYYSKGADAILYTDNNGIVKEAVIDDELTPKEVAKKFYDAGLRATTDLNILPERTAHLKDHEKKRLNQMLPDLRDGGVTKDDIRKMKKSYYAKARYGRKKEKSICIGQFCVSENAKDPLKESDFRRMGTEIRGRFFFAPQKE